MACLSSESVNLRYEQTSLKLCLRYTVAIVFRGEMDNLWVLEGTDTPRVLRWVASNKRSEEQRRIKIVSIAAKLRCRKLMSKLKLSEKGALSITC